MVDTRPLPLPAKTAIAFARLFERPSTKGGESRLSAALTRLGPTYVKLGQFLATRQDVVGTKIARDLESLQDKMAPFPQSEAEAMVAPRLVNHFPQSTQISDQRWLQRPSRRYTARKSR